MPDLIWPSKDPDEVKDFGVRWATELAGDVLFSSVFSIVSGGAGLTLGAPTFDQLTSRTKVWLSAGVTETDYRILNRVTTTGGRTLDQTMLIRVKSH